MELKIRYSLDIYIKPHISPKTEGLLYFPSVGKTSGAWLKIASDVFKIIYINFEGIDTKKSQNEFLVLRNQNQDSFLDIKFRECSRWL